MIEQLHGEVHEIERAIAVLARVRGELAGLRAGGDVALPMLVDEFETDYGEACVGTCILAPVCASRHRATTRSLGAAAVDALGETQLDVLYRLLDGGEPRDDFEAVLATKIGDALSALGIDGRGVA